MIQNVLDKGLIRSGTINPEYTRIKTELLIRVVPLKADIYVRLSDERFVKIFKKGFTFKQAELEKFLYKKNIRYLYLKSTETQEFIEKFKERRKNLWFLFKLNLARYITAQPFV